MLISSLTRNKLRIAWLATIFCGITFTLINSIIYPQDKSKSSQSFIFPTSIPLPGWKLIKSAPLAIKKTSPEQSSDVIKVHQYQYMQNNLQLNIQVMYMVNVEGNVSRLLNKYTSLKSSRGMKEFHQVGVGYYGIFVNENHTFLCSCINPRGNSTLTQQQFMKNRYTYDLQPYRVVQWLFSQADLIDHRCLFSLFSVSGLDNTEAEKIEKLDDLKKVWVAWQKWWRIRFPDP